MSNGQDRDNPQEIPAKKRDVGQTITDVGDVASKLGQAVETLFGPAQPAPYVPSHVSTGPPQMASPPGGFSTSGGGGGRLPPAPQPGGSPGGPPPSIMNTGVEFRTDAGRRGAVVGGAIGNIAGALHTMSEDKKKSNIQHAQFLYDLVKTSYESGDERTANLILGDDKNRGTIEKYLTGKLPRLSTTPNIASPDDPTPKGPQPTKPGSKQPPMGEINQPGGPALPRAGQQQQMTAAIQNMIMEGLKNKDPRIMSQVLGEQSTLSKEDYSRSVRAKFGIELSPAQVQAMDAKAQLALAEAKTDILKTVLGQGAMTDRAVAVAKIHAGASVEAGAGHDRARLESMKMYSDALKTIRGSAPDKMEQVMYKSLGDVYSKLASNALTASGKLAKDNPKLAKQYEDEAKEMLGKAEGMKSQYEAGKLFDDIMNAPDTGGGEESDDEPEKPDPSDN